MSTSEAPTPSLTPTQRARAAWGADAPVWVMRLAEACEAESQAKVAARLNRSPSLVSAVLAAKYTGDLAAVEEVVAGVFMSGRVTCPALGTIPSSTCQDWRRASARLVNVNALRVQMFRACNRCPLNKSTVKKDHNHE